MSDFLVNEWTPNCVQVNWIHCMHKWFFWDKHKDFYKKNNKKMEEKTYADNSTSFILNATQNILDV